MSINTEKKPNYVIDDDPSSLTDRDIDVEHKDGFGNKTIGPVGSAILLFNNLSGPGVVGLPLLFQQAGWLVPVVTMIWIGITTFIASSMLCEAMRYYPKNRGYSSRIEFSTLCKFYFGHKFYLFTQIIFVISLQSVNVSAIIETAQVMDELVIAIFTKTGALEFYPTFGWTWADIISQGSSCFPDDSYVLSLGFVVTVILIIPMGYFNLDDNMIVQKGAFLIACLIFIEWFVVFIIRVVDGLDYPLVPVVYYGDAAPVFGVIMFNYAMVITVPSWCNEKTHATSINRSLGYSIFLGTILFLFVGLLGGISYQISPDGGDLLSAIDASPQGGIVSSICVYLFPISVVATSIPIYSIIVRYNLLENKICNKPVANFIGVVLPWLVTIPFYTGQGLNNVINWSSLISGGIINFIIPFWIYVRAKNYKLSLSSIERQEIDEPLGSQFKEEDDSICFDMIKFEGEEPAPPHFAFACLSDRSPAAMVIAYTFMGSLTISVVGVIIINILKAIGVH